MKVKPEELNTVVVTDCGSTTTKALLFQRTDQGWRQTSRGEAPTTVEKPVADVTVGALNAFQEIQEVSQRQILSENQSSVHPFHVSQSDLSRGIDLYLSTSSAGGGLQMMVTGVVDQITTESAERAALGAGAIVLEALSADDPRADHEKIERIRHLRPDIVLLAGGVDGGSTIHVTEAAEILLAAAPRPRFGDTLQLPVIFAGNKDAAGEVEEILRDFAQVSVVENVRPQLDRENLGPAREAIHEFFLTHVMSHSPGYDKLLKWSPVPIMPTPAAVGDMVVHFAQSEKVQVLCADIGGATTDVFSVFRNDQGEDVFNRTVSANLGMSYSVANVLIESGTENIARWLPYELNHAELRDRLRNKMIRPTSIPQTKEDLWLEQAVCREALRLSLDHHRSLAVGLSGAQKQSGIADIFSQSENRYELVNRKTLDVVIGSGGVLSHAPHRLQAALMMVDGFALEGVTQVTVDSIFMMPHLGVLSSVYPAAAAEIFQHDCIVNICHAVCPVYRGRISPGTPIAKISFEGQELGVIKAGSVQLFEVPQSSRGVLRVEPLHRNVDVGCGVNEVLERSVVSGLYGFLGDGRNRPIELDADSRTQCERQQRVFEELGF
ncbi:MAG: glutamate mutase L [Bdellovibrionales bacterium]|nr:glutamate mutase L [Bdellovibrionales bacterium]